MRATPRYLRPVAGWAVWRIPARLLLAVLVVEALAVGLVIAGGLSRVVPTTTHLIIGGALCLAVVLHNEAALGIERMRRRTSPTHYVDLNSVWTFAAALLLPPLLASALVAVTYGYLYVRFQRPLKMPLYRHLYNASTVVVAVHAAAAVIMFIRPDQLYGTVSGTFSLVLALLAYTVVNTCLVLGVVAMATPDVRVMRVLGSGDELTLELATLCMGALAAGALSSTTPFVLLLVIPPVLVLHRTILVRQLEERADTDAKTGLLNAAAWHNRSGTALASAEREGAAVGLLILDLDHFKAINDTYGHLAGDEVLSAIANTLRDEVRDDDLVGRFGGEEFVVLLPRLTGGDTGAADTATAEAGAAEVRRVAHRIRRRIRELQVEVAGSEEPVTIAGVTISIGGAVFPHDGESLTALVETADSALYAAKRSGRDTVRTGPYLFPAAERPGGDPSTAGPATAPGV